MMIPMIRCIARAALAAFVLAASALAQAQDWPTKPIRLVVPFAPGGSSEIVARSVAAELSKQLGQQVFVENKPGGAGTIAMAEVARAAPDGYTLILGHIGTLAVNPYAMKRQPYDVNKDFVPVTLLARVPNVLAVNPDVVPAKTFKEFVALAKSKPGALNYGSAGMGSAGHLAFEYLKTVTGIYVVHIPYRGTGPLLQDLLAGRVESTFSGVPALAGQIKAGKLRPLAVGAPERIPSMPDVPTVAEMGFPGFETSQWYGIVAPAGVPQAVIDRLAAETNKALKSAAVTSRFAQDDAVAAGGSPQAFAAFIKKEQERWAQVVKRANITIE
jgi:tripartite-type tricarboxylate transporter receptor subunit TctC